MSIRPFYIVVLLALLGSCDDDGGYKRSYIISNSTQEPVEAEPEAQR